MIRRGVTILTTIGLLLPAGAVAADPERVHVVTEAPRLLCLPPAPSSACRNLPAGHFVDQGSWSALDKEMKRAQDAETRLTAENKSLRTTMQSWSPGWKTLLLTTVTAFAAGAYVAYKL